MYGTVDLLRVEGLAIERFNRSLIEMHLKLVTHRRA